MSEGSKDELADRSIALKDTLAKSYKPDSDPDYLDFERRVSSATEQILEIIPPIETVKLIDGISEELTQEKKPSKGREIAFSVALGKMDYGSYLGHEGISHQLDELNSKGELSDIGFSTAVGELESLRTKASERAKTRQN